ncbi:hypothetical protein ACQZV8_01780 [Magnetococcales bacterium HHB-1]
MRPFRLDAFRKNPENRLLLLRRINFLQETFDEISREKEWKGIFLNEEILTHAVYNYFIDLGRFKSFHDIVIANHHKRAAFTAKWICLCKPVQVSNSSERGEGKVYPMLANEVLAFYACLIFLDLPIAKISQNYKSAFLYKLHFRPIIAETLLSEMYALECACHGRTP